MVICYSENMLNTDPRKRIIYEIVNQLCIPVIKVFIHFQKKVELCFGVISKTSPILQQRVVELFVSPVVEI